MWTSKVGSETEILSVIFNSHDLKWFGYAKVRDPQTKPMRFQGYHWMQGRQATKELGCAQLSIFEPLVEYAIIM